ncbi:MAG: hypothetical protein WC998_06160 [Candidatus Paceibacterota bacterium]
MKKALFGSLDVVKLENYSLDGPGGEKSVSGSLNVSGSGTFTYADDVSTAGFNAITVTGLTFMPTKIICVCPAKGALVVYNADQPIHSSYPNGKIGLSSNFNSTYTTSGTLRNIVLDGTVAYVTTSGFRLPHPTSQGDLYYWWAFE